MDMEIEVIEKDARVVALSNRTSEVVRAAEALDIKDQDTEVVAISALASVAKERKASDELRDAFVRPLNEHVKKINDLFRPRLEALRNAEAIIKARLVGYQAQVAAKAAAEKAKIMARVEKQTMTAETSIKKIEKIVEPEKTTRTNEATVSYRTDYEVEVTDLALLPREFFDVNMAKVRSVSKALAKAGQPGIAGVKVTEIKVPSIRPV